MSMEEIFGVGTLNVLTFIGGLMLSIIGYFLRNTMNELKEVKEVAFDTKVKVKVLENDYLNKIEALNKKFDLLADNIKELNQNIQKLNDKIK
jgi:peptidoglycan hydrolase CwlO-like protein